MGKRHDPAFLFYSDNFMTGTIFFSNSQTGKYIRLLCAQHLTGHLSEQDMLKICGTYDKAIYSKFVRDSDGLFYNERLESEIIKRKAYTESRKKNREKKETYVPHMGNGNIYNTIGEKNETQKIWDSYLLPHPKKVGAELTEQEIIALIRIPFGKRTQEQNRQVGEFTTSHPEFETEKYTQDIY